MPKGPKGQKRPGDVIRAAIKVAKIATGEVDDETMAEKEYAQKGGVKDGVVQAQRLTAEQQQKIAQRTAQARWRTDS